MPDWPDYELIDFGRGRKLERFGTLVGDRPCLLANEAKSDAAIWKNADAIYTGAKVGDGKWKHNTTRKPLAENLRSSESTISVPLLEDLQFQMQLELTPAGQVGLFPEQYANWRWIAQQIRRVKKPLKILNLFAYTGGSTLAAACAGKEFNVEVTHIDAAKPSVALARQNAELSGLADAPIRWIVEDAVKYCRREVKRGKQYDAAILDPPSYGHGPKGEEWKLERDLPVLLELCGELTGRAPVFLLASCHTPTVGPAELSAYLSDGIFGSCGQPPTTGHLWLTTQDDRRLESGVYARWPH